MTKVVTAIEVSAAIWTSARLVQFLTAANEAGYQIVHSVDHPGCFEWMLARPGCEIEREGYFDTVLEALEAACGEGDYFANPFALAA